MSSKALSERAIAAVLMMAYLAWCLCALPACASSDMAREQLRRESEYECGVMRTVTAYSTTGEQIGQWHGKIDVQYSSGDEYSSPMERVDVVVFDGDKPIDRIVISGAIVVVDND